ncbi:11325_t:CDS:10 [Rhizophagus irregularis]|nr:11325_t:CDS:10 [Rhizophagus irregularis]
MEKVNSTSVEIREEKETRETLTSSHRRAKQGLFPQIETNIVFDPLTVYSYNVIPYNETEPGLEVYKVFSYRDETAVILLIKPINESCVEPRIDLRILHPNGTIDSAKVDYPIPEYNFCLGPNGFYWFDITRSLPKFLLVLYADIVSASYYVLVITRTGYVISNTPVAPISIINGSIYADGYLMSHTSEEYGFIFANYETETAVMWKYYNKPDDKGNISLINEGKHYLQNPFNYYFIFPALDGNFGIIIANSTDINIKPEPNKFINPSKFTSKVYVSFIKPVMNSVDGPYLIYQSTIPHFEVDFFCDTAFTGIGNMCILTFNRAEDKNTTEYMTVLFQTSGSVFDMRKLFVDKEIIGVNSLFQGGYLITTHDDQNKTIEGIILDDNGKYNGTWSYPPDLNVSNSFGTAAFRNGTLFLVTFENEMTWKVISTPLPKFFSDDYGYENPNIKSTYPLISSINIQDNFAEESIGRFSLTDEGTKSFEKLSLDSQRGFLSQLRIDLAKSIPVDINRLDYIKCCEYDNSKQPPRILLSLPIKSTTNPYERNVDHIIKDLDILIKNKEVTPISWFGTTNHLEASFGFQRYIPFNWYCYWNSNFRIPLYLRQEEISHGKGKNIVIFKFPLIILNFIMGIMFILNNGKNVPQLFIPSIIFFVIPIIINFIMAAIIMLQEIKKNRDFYGWFKNNVDMASLFTILSGTNIEMLNILSSQVAGIILFNAPISEETQFDIFWGSFIGLFIGDIPRFIIQVFYIKLVVNYDIIPFLTLSTSSIILANNIITKIYHAIVHLYSKKRKFVMILQTEKILCNSANENSSITVPQKIRKTVRHSM